MPVHQIPREHRKWIKILIRLFQSIKKSVTRSDVDWTPRLNDGSPIILPSKTIHCNLATVVLELPWVSWREPTIKNHCYWRKILGTKSVPLGVQRNPSFQQSIRHWTDQREFFEKECTNALHMDYRKTFKWSNIARSKINASPCTSTIGTLCAACVCSDAILK